MTLGPSEKYHLRARAKLCAYDLVQIRDEAYLKRKVYAQLREQLAELILRTGTTTQSYNAQEGVHEHTLDVYVFSPEAFARIVRDEAQRLFDRVMQGPSFYDKL